MAELQDAMRLHSLFDEPGQAACRCPAACSGFTPLGDPWKSDKVVHLVDILKDNAVTTAKVQR